MSASHIDYALTALTLWREDRGGGNTGMTAVGCVVRNRVLKNSSSFYIEVTKYKQFTSISVKSDPEIALWPQPTNPAWIQAQLIAGNVIDGQVADITQGAVDYYAPAGIVSTKTITLPGIGTVKFPETWDADVLEFTVSIGGQLYFKPK